MQLTALVCEAHSMASQLADFPLRPLKLVLPERARKEEI
jgi:hypothetical protein